MTYFPLLSIGILLTGALLVWVSRARAQSAALFTVAISLVSLWVGAAGSGSCWLEVDRVGLVVGTAALVIGGCAIRYAARQFADERRATSLVAISYGVVAAVLATDLAANAAVLALGWLATSASVVALLHVGAPASSRSVVRRAVWTFAVTDSVLLLGLSVVGLANLSLLTAPFSSGLSIVGVAAPVLLASATLAAMGRAGLTTRTSWVTSTIATPTSVSALLHAGVVNAGAVLLLRLYVLSGRQVIVSALTAVVCVVLLVVLAPRIATRVDLKGQLATSTVAQMAFMLLALALGWPLLALTHLVGHGLYKALRFMIAGGAITSRSAIRRLTTVGTELATTSRVLGTAAIGVLGLAAGIVLGGDPLAAAPVLALGAGSIFWLRTSTAVERVGALWVVTAAGLLAYLSVVVAFEHALGSALTGRSWQSPWYSLALLVLIVTVTQQVIERRQSTTTLPALTPPRRSSPILEGVAA